MDRLGKGNREDDWDRDGPDRSDFRYGVHVDSPGGGFRCTARQVRPQEHDRYLKTMTSRRIC